MTAKRSPRSIPTPATRSPAIGSCRPASSLRNFSRVGVTAKVSRSLHLLNFATLRHALPVVPEGFGLACELLRLETDPPEQALIIGMPRRRQCLEPALDHHLHQRQGREAPSPSPRQRQRDSRGHGPRGKGVRCAWTGCQAQALMTCFWRNAMLTYYSVGTAEFASALQTDPFSLVFEVVKGVEQAGEPGAGHGARG